MKICAMMMTVGTTVDDAIGNDDDDEDVSDDVSVIMTKAVASI